MGKYPCVSEARTVFDSQIARSFRVPNGLLVYLKFVAGFEPGMYFIVLLTWFPNLGVMIRKNITDIQYIADEYGQTDTPIY